MRQTAYVAEKDARPVHQECIGAHSKYALVVGGKVYTLSGTGLAFEKYAGKRVRIGGKIDKDAIVVGSIRQAARQ